MSNWIKIINLHKKYRLNEGLLKKIIRNVLKYIKKSGAAELEIVFLGDKSIRRLNKKYKKTDRATDVLSFRLDRYGPVSKKFLGDIFISVDRAFANSKIFKTDPGNELVLYVIHGILHLFGYDDGTAAGRRRMQDKEKKILARLCRSLSGVLTPP
jgi:probable rRNA maturation factor